MIRIDKLVAETSRLGYLTSKYCHNTCDEAMRFEGLLKSWDDERGFGFLEPLQGGDDIFVHIKALRVRSIRPQAGQAMSFEIEVGPGGKRRAKNVEPIRPGRVSRRKPKESSFQRGVVTLFAIPLFVILYLVVGVLWQPPLFIAVVYVVASSITFLVYASDKSAARQNAWRTREATLHLLALAGGWPGALLAQQILHHKSIKSEFRMVFWATVILNAVAFVLLCSQLSSFGAP